MFNGITKGVFDCAKFDSKPELILARVLERDKFVKNWLRPAKKEFNITYNRGKQYEPDFVVETENKIYLIEVISIMLYFCRCPFSLWTRFLAL